MQIDQTTITYLIGIGTIVSMLFGWWNSIKKIQERSVLQDAIFNERFKSLEDIVINLRDNHLHSIEEKFDKHIAENQRDSIKNAKQMSRIETLLEEIIRKKND